VEIQNFLGVIPPDPCFKAGKGKGGEGEERGGEGDFVIPQRFFPNGIKKYVLAYTK
jgi:hypothetical protein